MSWRQAGGYEFKNLKTSRKTKKRGRAVSIPAGLATVLRNHRAEQSAWFMQTGVRSDLVFCTSEGGPLHPRNVTMRGLKPALMAAGLPGNFTLYGLRHSYASMMLKFGAHLKVVSEALGHSNVELTLNTYSHLIPGLLDSAMAQLNSALYSGSELNNVNSMNDVNTTITLNTLNELNTVESAEQIA